jgi:hypothetical protein|tara:strand:+ start:31 stop:720 length:690 start_codon:yes stop_codon:yes gene_type:complete
MMGKTKVEFFCDERCKGIIPEPFEARKHMPGWYKKLGSTHKDEKGFNFSTLKRCPPFLDALCTGWILPLAADVDFVVQDDGAGVSWQSEFFLDVVATHSVAQIETHPKAPRVPIKLLNQWLVRTPPGWSSLFVAPLNRPDDQLELMSGIVETDKYFEIVNFPGFLKTDQGNVELKSGHPLMQVIPFKRGLERNAHISALGKKEMRLLARTRDKRSSMLSLYRDKLWEKK